MQVQYYVKMLENVVQPTSVAIAVGLGIVIAHDAS